LATATAAEYELVLMLDPEVADDRRDQIAVEARRRIESAGELKQERSWGLRKMAYEINQRTEADYRFFRFEKGGAVLDELNHNLKITDGVLRFRIFKVDPRAPVIDPPPPISLAATASPRAGGRRRDDDRPPRGPEPDLEAPAEPAPTTAESAPEPEPEPEPAPEPEAPVAEPEAPVAPPAEPAEGDADEQPA
jgi:small subunit ribosomal protein S6